MSRKPRRSRQEHHAEPIEPPREVGRSGRAIMLVVCLAATVAMLAILWGVPRPIGDLYMGLSGGRDVMDGRLAQPDDWSFTTTDRVWVNQNWITHLLLYGAWSAIGDAGILLVKAGLIAAMALAVVLASRERGVAWPAAILTAGCVAIAARSYIDMRPNLVSFVLAPLLLWLLYQTQRRPHMAWVAAAVLGLWANMHGGFIFGLGMMALWTLCLLGPPLLRGKHDARAALRRWWPVPAAALVALALGAFVNPYGLENLTHPLVVGRSEVWRVIDEWEPIFTKRPVAFGTVWEFLIAVGFLAVLTPLRALSGWIGRQRAGVAERRGAPGQISLIVFEVALGIVVLVMAFSARRFIPLALMLLAPTLAGHLAWITRPRERVVPTLLAVALIGVPAGMLGAVVVRQYHPDHPFWPPETVAQRMITYRASFCADAIPFINANGLQGRVLNEWRWEGLLRWRCPQLKLWMGGRAQQVYAEETFKEWRKLQARPTPQALVERDVHQAIVPGKGRTGTMWLVALVWQPSSTWALIYFDESTAVLADTRHPSTRDLVARAAAGRLIHDDLATAAVSRAMCLASPALGTPPEQVASALMTAARLRPLPMLYDRLWRNAGRTPDEAGKVVEYLENEDRRLAAMDFVQPGGGIILGCRMTIAAILSNYYGRLRRDPVAARRWQATLKALDARLQSARDHWLVR